MFTVKFSQLVDKEIFTKEYKVGKIKDVIIDPDNWKVTHLEVEISKETSEEILGIKPALLKTPRNKLAISALEKGDACCSARGIELKVSKGQLGIYLRPL